MAIENLQGIPTEVNEDTIAQVTDLLNNASVTIGEISQHFSVPVGNIIQSLTGLPQGQFANNGYSDNDAVALKGLVDLGFATEDEVATFAGAPVETVRQFRSNFTPAVDTSTTEDTSAAEEEIPTGLRGSEEALRGGTDEAIAVLDQINQQTDQTLSEGYQEALDAAAAQAEAARSAVTAGTDRGVAALNAAINRGIAAAQRESGRAEGMFDPYRDAGTTALDVQLALSGALGQGAFDSAYVDSPYIDFLREQGLRSNLAGAAATGGLGGGNIQKELVRFGQGLASKGVQDQINNLSTISGYGLDATTGAANVASRLGGVLADLSSAQGTGALNAYTNQGANLSNIATNLGNQQAQAYSNLADQLAGTALKTGLSEAEILSNLGINLSTGRTNAGQALADQFGGAARDLRDIYTGQGDSISNLLTGQTKALIDAYGTAAINEANAQQGYGSNQSNIQSNIASNISGVPNTPLFSPDYQSMTMDFLNAAGSGYRFGQDSQNDGSRDNGDDAALRVSAL